MIVSGPVGNPESSWVYKRSLKTINQSPNQKFLGLSLSTTSLVEPLLKSYLRGGTLESHGQSRQPSDNGRDKGWNVIVSIFLCFLLSNSRKWSPRRTQTVTGSLQRMNSPKCWTKIIEKEEIGLYRHPHQYDLSYICVCNSLTPSITPSLPWSP